MPIHTSKATTCRTYTPCRRHRVGKSNSRSRTHRRPAIEDTSAQFTDAAEPWLEINAASVMYVATSNDARAIARPLMTSLTRFDITPPTRAQSRVIVSNIFDDVKKERMGAYGPLRLTPEAVDVLLSITPRRIKKALKNAAGAALYEKRHTIQAEDVEIEKPRPAMGFS